MEFLVIPNMPPSFPKKEGNYTTEPHQKSECVSIAATIGHLRKASENQQAKETSRKCCTL